MHRRAVARQHPAHGIAVHVQLWRDGAHAPLPCRLQAQNLRHQIRAMGMAPALWQTVTHEAHMHNLWLEGAAVSAEPDGRRDDIGAGVHLSS